MQIAPAGSSATIVAQTDGDPKALAASLRAAVHSANPLVPISLVATVDDVVSSSIVEPRLYATLLGAFALLALVLACVGLYGLIAYSVSQRRHEFGVRVALGAAQSTIVRLVVVKGCTLQRRECNRPRRRARGNPAAGRSRPRRRAQQSHHLRGSDRRPAADRARGLLPPDAPPRGSDGGPPERVMARRARSTFGVGRSGLRRSRSGLRGPEWRIQNPEPRTRKPKADADRQLYTRRHAVDRRAGSRSRSCSWRFAPRPAARRRNRSSASRPAPTTSSRPTTSRSSIFRSSQAPAST